MTRKQLLLGISGLAAATPYLSAQTTPAAAVKPTAPMSSTLKVGDTAPDFTLASYSGGKVDKVHLADLIGKKTLVLAFFPAAFTGG
jgi:thioredoxin-dependent peroxiredoxin